MFERDLPLILQDPPSQFSTPAVFDVSFPSSLDQKSKILAAILEKFAELGWLKTEADHLQVRLVLDEGLVNAVRHGNKEDESKKVTFSMWQEDDRWRCRIEDEGDGFNIDIIPDPTDPENMFLDHGRGIAYMHAFFDEVQYYGNGRILELARKYDRPQKGPNTDDDDDDDYDNDDDDY